MVCWPAQGWSKVGNPLLSAQYHRLAGRRGKKRAVVAVAHSILVIASPTLRRREPYRELGGNYFDERKKESIVNRLMRRIQTLGYTSPPNPLSARGEGGRTPSPRSGEGAGG